LNQYIPKEFAVSTEKSQIKQAKNLTACRKSMDVKALAWLHPTAICDGRMCRFPVISEKDGLIVVWQTCDRSVYSA
jgi:hypothetical protein